MFRFSGSTNSKNNHLCFEFLAHYDPGMYRYQIELYNDKLNIISQEISLRSLSEKGNMIKIS